MVVLPWKPWYPAPAAQENLLLSSGYGQTRRLSHSLNRCFSVRNIQNMRHYTLCTGQYTLCTGHNLAIRNKKSVHSQMLALFPGPAQLPVACSTVTGSWAGPGNEASQMSCCRCAYSARHSHTASSNMVYDIKCSTTRTTQCSSSICTHIPYTVVSP